MNIQELHKSIKESRSKGESYQSIADRFGVEKSLIKYIESHPNYKPTKETAGILRLDPSPKLTATRARQQKLNMIARDLGYENWSNYGTRMIEKWENHNQGD